MWQVASGLIALLDDVAALAKLAAASLDDVAAQAGKAGTKALGVVVDDAAVTPRFVTGLAAAREIPIVARIAVGSLRNKLLFLLPGALALSLVAPWLITPLLMLGGLYLCYEGAEKILHAIRPGAAHKAEPDLPATPQAARALEERRVRSAIQTDFILSAEIMALTLAGMPEDSAWPVQVAVLALVGTGITLLVYGAVALIVKADDAGVALAANPRPATSLLGLRSVPERTSASGADRALRRVTQPLGRLLVTGMPRFLKLLAIVGTAAMLWVGGGILLHGLEELGLPWPAHMAHDAGHAAAQAVPSIGGALDWLVYALISALVGLVVGAALVPLAGLLAPLAARVAGLFGRSEAPISPSPASPAAGQRSH
jgi:predicted DNA repair protein MutK